MKKIIITAITTAVVALGAFIYAEILFRESIAIVIIKTISTLAFAPLIIGLLIGLLPTRLLNRGILPLVASLALISINWIIYDKTWIVIPDNKFASVVISFVVLGVLVFAGTEIMKVIKQQDRRLPT